MNTSVSRTLSVSVISEASVEGQGSTDAAVLGVAGYRYLRLRREAQGNVTIQVYGPKADGTKSDDLLASIEAGKDGFSDTIDVAGFERVWIAATDTSESANVVTVEAYLGS